ncbi:MAG: restriction endonuclease subunit S, partial [Rhodospirillaceae bacterium]
LGSLDDKIELNRRMNETLEGMAQALFKSWFVDFDPVIDNALAAGNPIPEPLAQRAETRRQALANGTANRESAQAFPASFRFTEELGWIPEGWEVKELKELCVKIQNGGTPRRSTSEFWDDGTIPWLTSGEVRQPLITKTNNFITDLGLSKSSAKWIPAHSTVVAMYGATAGQVSFTSRALTTNQAICALVPKEGFKFFNYLNLRESVTHLENQARGSAQQNISKGIIETTKTILPAPNIAESFESFCLGIFEKWTKNTLSCATLAKLRDMLLPKLISGELRIPQAEKMVEKAVA